MSTSDYTNTPPTPEDAQRAIMSPITETLTKHDITIDTLSQQLKKLIKAKKPLVIEGNIHEVEDNASQLKAVDMGLKLNRAYPADRLQVEGDTGLTVKLVQYGQVSPEDKNITGCNHEEKTISSTGGSLDSE